MKTKELLVSPFEDDIISEPRQVKKSVSGLNQSPLDDLLLRFEELLLSEIPRNAKLAHVQLVSSPEKGYGKSHLIGRLFQQLDQKATLVYLSPFGDPGSCWKSILLKTVQELNFPDRIDRKRSPDDPTQLETFAHGILNHMLVQGLENESIPSKNKDNTIKAFESLSITDFRKDKKKLQWVKNRQKKLIGLYSEQLKRNGVYLNASPFSWLGVLFTCAYYPDQYELRDTCQEWLKGGSIDPDEAKEIGIKLGDIGTPDMGSDGINGLCKERILDFCKLAGFFRPFVFCFDQTDEYGTDIVLSKALGSVIQILRDDCWNNMTVMTVNQPVWTHNIRPWLQDAQADRLSSALELEGLDKKQALELIELRLEGWEDIEEKNIDSFYDLEWIDYLFQKDEQIGIRDFLKKCDNRWRVLKGTSPNASYSIEEYYNKAVEDIKTRQRRLAFDPDILLWLVKEAGKGLEGLTPEKYSTRKNYFILVWKSDEMQYFFGFEGGTHWKRWKAIVNEAELINTETPKSKFIFIRTRELKKIPGEKWKIAELINNAKQQYLCIISLTKDETAELYAGYDLYIDAGEGNIPFKRHEILAFLKEKLDFFWEKIKKPVSCTQNNRKNPPVKKITKELIDEIRELVHKNIFLSVDDLMEKLDGKVSKETVYEIQEYIPEIRIHTHPNMTVFQWQNQ
ncbi:hypothetical protein QUF70_09665 [Desulfobacterales bacterium HSG17]|nr:hypothetical protein [Desulfobacterales bacterium HSG17]